MTPEERKKKVLHPWGQQAYEDFAENGTSMIHEGIRNLGYSIVNCCLWPSAYNSSMTYDWPVEVTLLRPSLSDSPVHLVFGNRTV